MGTPQNGTIIGIYVGGTKIANLLSNDFGVDMSPRDITTKDSGGWKEIASGEKSWKASGKGYFADAATYGFSNLWAEYIAATGVTVMVTSNVSGEKKYSGSAYITSLTQNADNQKTAEFAVSFEGTGVIAQATV